MSIEYTNNFLIYLYPEQSVFCPAKRSELKKFLFTLKIQIQTVLNLKNYQFLFGYYSNSIFSRNKNRKRKAKRTHSTSYQSRSGSSFLLSPVQLGHPSCCSPFNCSKLKTFKGFILTGFRIGFFKSMNLSIVGVLMNLNISVFLSF